MLQVIGCVVVCLIQSRTFQQVLTAQSVRHQKIRASAFFLIAFLYASGQQIEVR